MKFTTGIDILMVGMEDKAMIADGGRIYGAITVAESRGPGQLGLLDLMKGSSSKQHTVP